GILIRANQAKMEILVDETAARSHERERRHRSRRTTHETVREGAAHSLKGRSVCSTRTHCEFLIERRTSMTTMRVNHFSCMLLAILLPATGRAVEAPLT